MKLGATAQLFKGLADRVRLRVLNAIAQTNEITGTQLAGVLRLPRSTVARHLRYLYRSRLVTTRHSHGEAHYALRREAEAIHDKVTDIIIHDLPGIEGLTRDNHRLAALRRTR